MLVTFQSRDYSSGILLPPQLDPSSRILYNGYCNGLVCLSNTRTSFLWNPSTKRFKTVPNPWGEYYLVKVFGWGYDSVSDDYKIFRIVNSSIGGKKAELYSVKAELYSVKADCWKEIEVHEMVVQGAFQKGPTIHGVLYMVGEHVLLSFDLHKEVFEVYPYPDSVKPKWPFASFIFEASFAMFFNPVGAHRSVQSLSLWMLDDVLGWTNKFNLEPDFLMHRVDLCLGNGQLVALQFNIRYFLYDLANKETKRLHFPDDDDRRIISTFKNVGLAGPTGISSLVKCTDSLVSLPGFEQVEKIG